MYKPLFIPASIILIFVLWNKFVLSRISPDPLVLCLSHLPIQHVIFCLKKVYQMIEVLKNQSHNILVSMLSLATASFQMSITTNNPDKGTILYPRVVLSESYNLAVLQSSSIVYWLLALRKAWGINIIHVLMV